MTGTNMDDLLDARDGLNRKQRIILYCLHQCQQERAGRQVPTLMLYGRVLEYLDMSREEFQAAISTLTEIKPF